MIPTTRQIDDSLKKVRPYLQTDGGDVECVRVTEDGIVEVRLTGACIDCPLSHMTLRAGIERALLREFEDIRRVEQVS
jgi:Fe-S cluster biogenesis protein NfuA